MAEGPRPRPPLRRGFRICGELDGCVLPPIVPKPPPAAAARELLLRTEGRRTCGLSRLSALSSRAGARTGCRPGAPGRRIHRGARERRPSRAAIPRRRAEDVSLSLAAHLQAPYRREPARIRHTLAPRAPAG